MSQYHWENDWQKKTVFALGFSVSSPGDVPPYINKSGGDNKIHRRKMLTGMTGVAASWRAIASTILGPTRVVEAAPNPSTSTHGRKPDAARVTFHPDDVLNLEAMRPRGQWYEATVPDTLDLTERAKLSINVLTNSMDPERYYGVQGISLKTIPKRSYGTWNMTPKNSRTLPHLTCDVRE